MERVTASAPGRVNLIGEHTDYNAGLALPFAIEQRATVTMARAKVERTPSAYLAGVLAALREAHDLPPVEVALRSDVPIGAGLSSSAALTCATALAANELFGLGLSREDLVLVAQRAENEYVGAPTGILDQSASLLCTSGHALLLDCASRASRQVPLDLGELRLLVVDTGVNHALVDGDYGDRRRECEEAASALGLGRLSEATGPGDLAEPLAARVRHVISENERVRQAVAALEAGEPAGLGPLLTASHASLRDDLEVSWPEADLVVERVLDAGAAGARMIGGGFGGSVLVLTREPRGVRSALRDEAMEVFDVRPAGGARIEPERFGSQ